MPRVQDLSQAIIAVSDIQKMKIQINWGRCPKTVIISPGKDKNLPE
jgi:hypothetical protein